MGANAERMQTVVRCIRELETVFDDTKIQIAGLKGVLNDSEFKLAGPRCAEHWNNQAENMSENLKILAALSTGLKSLKAKIDASTSLDRPIKSLQIPKPMYAYEAGEKDSNYHLTGRARKILQSVVTIDEHGYATPNMTTFMFGPKGNETELVGWEPVGLHSMLVVSPNELFKTGGWGVVSLLKNDERFAPFAAALSHFLPRKRDILMDKQVGDVEKDVIHAPTEWVNFHKAYNPMCGNTFHKRIRGILEKIQKRSENNGRKRRKTCGDRELLRLDLPCEQKCTLSDALEHDMGCLLNSLKKDRIEIYLKPTQS